MRKIPILTATMALLVLPNLAAAQSVQQIFEAAHQRQVERWQGVDAYTVDQTIMGNPVSTWFIRTEYTDDAGKLQTFFVPMTQTQMQNRQCDVGMSADELEAFASGMQMTGDVMSTEIEDGMEEAGLPRGMLAATGTDPWNTMDPRVMMGGGAEFMRAAAEGKRQDQAYDPAADARSSVEHMQKFMENARVLGTEEIDGRKAWHIRAEGLNHVEQADDGEYRIDAISMYIDTAEYVPLSMVMDGVMSTEDESQPMNMGVTQSDYRQVPGSLMYESYRQVMTMSGMMTPEQEAELAEAQKQLAEFEKQKATLPPQQRIMMEAMMGPQMKMLESMSQGKGIEFETVVDRIQVNPVLTDAMGNACEGTGSLVAVEVEHVPDGSAGGGVIVVPEEEEEEESQATGSGGVIVTNTPPPAAPSSRPVVTSAPSAAAPTTAAGGGDELTLVIQQNLATLGYDVTPSGTLDTQTAIAISQYQAENDMPVTGEATPQLAGILAAKASAPQRSPEELQAAQQACLQQKMEEAQASQKKKRGFGRLLGGIGKLAGQVGNFDLARTANDVYRAGSTADDFAQAAKDLGLTEDDVAACQNPA